MPSSQRRPSLRRLAWLLSLNETELKPHEQGYAQAVVEHCPELEQVRDLAGRFRCLLHVRNVEYFDAWLVSAGKSLLRDFAASLGTDLRAVRAAVERPWSNGQTEGHVNRLKFVKRSMYGRAGFDLLRERVVNAP